MAYKYDQKAMDAIYSSGIEVAKALGYKINEKESNEKAVKFEGSGGLHVFRNGKGYINLSTGEKGNPVDFVMRELRLNTKIEAMDFINDNVFNGRYENIERNDYYKRESEPKGEFILPSFSKIDRVFAYLSKTRGIDNEIIHKMIEEKKIRQQDKTGNCCFIGYDKENNPKYCALRGTLSEKQFRGEVKNSKKDYGFCINGNSPVLKVFEAPIEVLSHATLAKMSGRDWQEDTRLSLGGCSDVALVQHLKDNPGKYSDIWFCLNSDEPGINAALSLANKYNADYNVSIKTPYNKDFNDDLKEIKKIINEHNCGFNEAFNEIKASAETKSEQEVG